MRQRKAKLIKYPTPMKWDEVGRVFAEQGEQNRIWQALDTLIDSILLDAINDVSESMNEIGKYAHAAGRVDAITNLKARVEELKQWKSGKTFFKKS